MKTKKIIYSLSLASILYIILVSFTSTPKNANYIGIQQKKWVAPESADKIMNPLKGDEKSLSVGKKLFKMQCAVCHGFKGKGDGVAGAGLSPKPANLTSEAVQSQTDGAIFWKIQQGNGPMPNYKSSLKEESRWSIINYIRTLK
ncbi:c-type cytochrome [Polaribacter sp.]|uniref:c-type cytochrome n=1 Tax=Polaribacter sp. TaxID=1920175 RepID=UPI00404764A4